MSDSEHSDDDDLMAYAATAGKAMEDSDEDIFSLQLPESPALSDDAVTTSNALDHQTPVNITTVSSNKSLTHVSKECSSKRPKTKEEQNSLVKKGKRKVIILEDYYVVVYFPIFFLFFFLAFICVFHRELQVLFQILDVRKNAMHGKTHLLNRASK